MKVRTRDRELLTSKGWINAGWVVDLPYEEAVHLVGMGKVDAVDPVEERTAEPIEKPRPIIGPARKNNALPRHLTR